MVQTTAFLPSWSASVRGVCAMLIKIGRSSGSQSIRCCALTLIGILHTPVPYVHDLLLDFSPQTDSPRSACRCTRRQRPATTAVGRSAQRHTQTHIYKVVIPQCVGDLLLGCVVREFLKGVLCILLCQTNGSKNPVLTKYLTTAFFHLY